MAFLDIFEEQRKKLNNYFGLGQPGLGTFGKQVSNVIKPTVSKNIQNYQKAGRYLSSQPSLAQRYTPVVGPVRSIVSDLKRPVGSSNIKQFGLGAGKEAVRNFNTMSYAPRLLSRKLYGEKVDQPVRNITNRINTAIDRRPATTWQGKTARFTGENAPYFAIPALPGAVKTGTALTRLGKNTLIRGGEGALYGGGRAMGEGKDWKGVAKDAATGFAFGAGANALLSPRVTGKALVEAKTGIQKGSQKYLRDVDFSQRADEIARTFNAKSIFDRLDDFEPTKKLPWSIKNKLSKELVNDDTGEKVMARLKEYLPQADIVNVNYYKTSKPAFAKLPDLGKKPSQPIVGANKGIDALKNEARKYKSAEEFANSKITRDYVSEITPVKSMGTKGSSLFTKTSSARRKAGEINDRILEMAQSDQKTFDLLKNKPIKELETKLAETKKFFNEKNASHPRSERIMQYIIDEKKRLTDFYSQSLSTNKGAVTPLKVNKPQKGIRLPLKDKKATEGLGTSVPPAGKGIVKPQLNTSKFDISEQAKKNLNETVASIKPELEKVKGGVLKNEDVVDAAKASKILTREVDPAKTKQATAAITRLRQEVAAGAEGKGLTRDFIENLKTLKSYSADAGRKLQAFNIKASPETSIKESIIADLVGLGKKSDDLIKAAKGVDFDNPKQVSKFYRQFVKPSLGEVLDEYRYINLLSSPQTHIVNAFSNLIQGTVLNPATKLYTGAIDSIGSRLTGKQRTAYLREVPAYSKGFINSMSDAFKQASEVMKGNKFVERPDINRLPTGKLGPGEYISRALEAGDVFFRRMIKGGEMEALAYKASRSGKKVPQSVMEKQAADAAEYFVFRKAPDPSNKTGQGAVLSGIDKATEAVYKFRNVPGVKWVIPFVQTPMNILKQGLEYSPLGVSTLAGNTNKTQQLAKALIGSTVLAGAATLESTWDAPTSKNEKEEFYASGRKPYSVKIGDNWVSYSRLGPLAYPMAMAAAVKWYFENDPKATSTDSIEKTTKLLGGIAGFFSDQSYLSGIGDLVSVAKGEDYAIKGMLANFGKQLVPLTSLQGWVARQLDPIYRQPKTITEQIKAGIPGLSKSIDPYTDPLGNPSKRENLPFNAWSPVNVNPANQQFEDIYQKRQLQKRSDAEAKALTSGTKQLPDGRVAIVINDEVKKFDSQEEANLAIAKEDFKKSGKNIQQYEDKVFRLQSDGDVKVQDKIDYDYSLNTNKLQRLKSSKDYKGWVETANKQLEILDKQLKDPTLDELEQSDLLEKADKILSDMAKYSEYGGFDKPKKGKKINISVSDLGSSKIPVKRAGKFAFKTSSTPKINIVSTKPKQITKSYLASIR